MNIKKTLKKLLNRPEWSHKGDFGKLLIIGGSRWYTGSPALAALAALRSGCDWATIACPEKISQTIASFSPDIITYPLPGNFLKPSHLKTLLTLSQKHDAVLIGGGMGTQKETQKLVKEFLIKTEKPCVIDADALKVQGTGFKPNFLLTPHAYEFFLLTGKRPATNLEERKALVKNQAKSLGCAILLKGSKDVISNGIDVLVNKTGNPFLTKAGTGDTLAGICASLLSQGFSVLESGFLASYINGKAGELASKEFGPGILASDLIKKIPLVIQS